jgi:hypothetical protein
LKAYLGLLNFYGKFIPNLSTELEPLYQLLWTLLRITQITGELAFYIVVQVTS